MGVRGIAIMLAKKRSLKKLIKIDIFDNLSRHLLMISDFELLADLPRWHCHPVAFDELVAMTSYDQVESI